MKNMTVGKNPDMNESQKQFFRIFFGCTHGMWKFPGQGSNPCHSIDLSQCSDNTRSSTHCTTRELHNLFLKYTFEMFVLVLIPQLSLKLL